MDEPARGFARDIRPRFREEDREAMAFVFDLSSYQEVKADAENILERLGDGTMPCDEPWSPEDVELFGGWIRDGCQP